MKSIYAVKERLFPSQLPDRQRSFLLLVHLSSTVFSCETPLGFRTGQLAAHPRWPGMQPESEPEQKPASASSGEESSAAPSMSAGA